MRICNAQLNPDELTMKPTGERSHIKNLEDLPNVGKAAAADFRLLGITDAAQLRGENPFNLYQRLCHLTGQRHDPCVLDVMIACVIWRAGQN